MCEMTPVVKIVLVSSFASLGETRARLLYFADGGDDAQPDVCVHHVMSSPRRQVCGNLERTGPNPRKFLMKANASTRETITETQAEMAVLSAFQAALESHLPIVASYRAGIAAWHQLHPEQVSAYASKQAVRIILRARFGGMNATHDTMIATSPG